MNWNSISICKQKAIDTNRPFSRTAQTIAEAGDNWASQLAEGLFRQPKACGWFQASARVS